MNRWGELGKGPPTEWIRPREAMQGAVSGGETEYAGTDGSPHADVEEESSPDEEYEEASAEEHGSVQEAIQEGWSENAVSQEGEEHQVLVEPTQAKAAALKRPSRTTTPAPAPTPFRKRAQPAHFICNNIPIAIPIWEITTYELARISLRAQKYARRPSSIQRHYCSVLEATICRPIRPYDLAHISLCAQKYAHKRKSP